MANEIIRINEETPSYCSMVAESRQEKAVLYNAVQNPDSKISDHINKKIQFVNVKMEQVEMTDEETGDTRKAIRTILITPEGKGILCTSNGIARSLYDMFTIFGTPDTWDGEVMECIVRQVETGKGRTFKLEVC